MSKTTAVKSSQIVSADDVLENVNEFIQSVYRDLSIFSPPPNTSTSRRTVNRPHNSHRSASPQSSPVSTSHASSLNSSASEEISANSETALAPPRFQAEVDRINRICDTVDQNLRSIGIIMDTQSRRYGSNVLSNDARDRIHRSRSRLSVDRNNLATTSNANETVYVDLSETQVITPVVRQRPQGTTNDDEVVVVSSNVIPIIDLCTPGHENTSTRPVIQRSRLSRRTLDHSNEFGAVPTRRRRSKKTTSEPEPIDDSVDDDQAKDDSSGRDPFICPVCMDSCLRRRPTSTKCGHVYCEQCIKQAIRVTHKCPLCNTKISASQLIRIYV